MAAQHPPNAHLCLDCCPTHTQHTHPCLDCCPAPTQYIPMSPLLLSNHTPAPLSPLLLSSHGPVPLLLSNHKPAPLSPLLLSSHEQWPPTKATAVLFPAVGCPRVVPKISEMCSLTNVTWPPGLPYCNLYYEPGTPGRRQQQQGQQSGPQRLHNAARAPSL